MMTSNKPYIIRAFYDWIVDNDVTPYIAVDATLPYVEVPEDYVTEGKIILNIEPSATPNLVLGNEWISFSARFGGVPMDINVPIGAIIAIYARENGHGIEFPPEPLLDDPFPADAEKSSPFAVIANDDNDKPAKKSPAKKETRKKATKKPSLTIVE
ncbi:ClpXP protease specificity-enhancing factor [Wohlfahrtiimonas sp. G9077]|uniref:ClpXP protease specificity-enhancing factor n=1 Tax=Wohlfahrtiimonas sp. G9077 TaxID=1980118 RepID=UPI000B98E7B3|nr:ClpXP protease specificity-enhancing factor [Wohlfahrtiimonas sp. G9077]OYQ75339.1 ClpXP protease specificity-enhancing factor [Wohlfahrtiimonas sp. G9077]